MIAATMTLDASTTAGPLLRSAVAPSFDSALLREDAAPRAAAAARLVLFVGVAPAAEVASVLAQDGMRCLWLAHPYAAIEAARLARFDAVVLGAASLGAAPATELARLRSALGCPLLVWAGPDDEVDEILALEQGADAYLPQPLAPRRLRAHLRALMRSHATPPPPPTEAPLHCAWRIDRVHNRLHGATRHALPLTEAQASLLQCLVSADGRVVPRAQLAQALLPCHGHALQARSIDVYVHRLRHRLRQAGALGYDIEAVRGRGYRLREPLADDPGLQPG